MTKLLPYAPLILKLLQGPVYQEDGEAWNLLLHHELALKSHFDQIGLALMVSETDGYAYLHQPELAEEDSSAPSLPRLVRRVKLTYDATLLCVLLRERLLQFETEPTASQRLVLTTDAMREMARLFFQERSDEVRLVRDIDRVIKQVEDLGYIRRLRGQDEAYEVRPIIKARISADQLAIIKEKLEAHADSAT